MGLTNLQYIRLTLSLPHRVILREELRPSECPELPRPVSPTTPSTTTQG